MDENNQLNELEKEVADLLNQSRYYLMTYKTIDALAVLEKAELKCGEGSVDSFMRGALFRNKAQAYMNMRQPEQAIECMKKALGLMPEDNDKAAIAGMLADVFLRTGHLEEAEEYSDMSISLCCVPDLLSKPYQIKGNVAALRGNFNLAIDYFNRGAKNAEETHACCDMAIIIMDIAEVFVKMGKLETAYGEMFRAERYVKEAGNLDLYTRLAIKRAALLYNMGRDAEAKAVILALSEQKN